MIEPSQSSSNSFDSQGGIGGDLQTLREASGFTIKQASQRLAISHMTLRRWESGKNPLSNRLTSRVREAYGLSKRDHNDNGIETCQGNYGSYRRKWSLEDPEPRPVLRLLRHKRRRLRLTLHEVAASVGVSAASWHRYETGQRIPESPCLEVLALGVGITGQEACAFTNALQQAESQIPTLMGLHLQFSCGETAAVSTFGALDSFVRFGKELEAPERRRALRAISRGISLAGDTESFLEAYELMRPLLQPGDVDLELKSMIALARVNTARRCPNAGPLYGRYQSLVHEALSAKKSTAEMDPFLNLTRMAVAAGHREDADYLLTLTEERFDTADLKPNLVPYRKIVDALFGKFEGIEVESPPSCPIWNYTFLVTSLFSARRAKRFDLATELRARCHEIENRLGLGSPLVKQMDMAGAPL